VNGAAELVEEAAKDKIGGAEERWSHTDLSDIAANIDGAQAVLRTVTPLLKNKDSALYNTLQRDLGAVTASLAEYRAAGGGYRPATDLQADDKARLQAELTTLAQNLAKVPAALDL
jgi:iron uptake system component EfeO